MKFYHIDIDEEAEEYAAICEQNMDKFGTSIEANEKVLRTLVPMPEGNQEFLDFRNGKITRQEYELKNAATQAMASGAGGSLVTESDHALWG